MIFFVYKIFLYTFCMVTLTTAYAFAERTNSNFKTSNLFNKIKPAIFQITTSLAANAPKSTYGSGFVIDPNGLVITNYHVISNALQDKNQQYKIFLVGDGVSDKAAQVMAIDVINDLALLFVPHKFSHFLPLSNHPPKKGDPIFSIGIPNDLNTFIIDGIYNGLAKYNIYEEIMFSGPLNTGMSGGPIVNNLGEVVGVNVAILQKSQNISFGISATHIKSLLDWRKTNAKLDITREINNIIEQQLILIQKNITQELLDKAITTQKWENTSLPLLPSSLKCWSNYQDGPQSYYQTVYNTCSLPHNTFISEEFKTGTYQIKYLLVKNKALNKLQYFNLLNELYQSSADSINFISFFNSNTNDYQKQFASKPSCSHTKYTNNNQITFAIDFCLISFLKYPTLYMIDLTATSIIPYKNNLIISITLNGITANNIKKIITHQLSNINIY